MPEWQPGTHGNLSSSQLECLLLCQAYLLRQERARGTRTLGPRNGLATVQMTTATLL